MSPQQKALMVPEKQGKLEVGSRSIPKPGTGELLVKVQSAALNPIDYHMVFLKHYPAVPGVDIAGIVEELGEGVENFRKGDKVLAHGAFNNDKAAFQQYTLTVASFTAKKPIVIIGGSSCVGLVSELELAFQPHLNRTAVIQLARLSGFYPIIATASPSNEDLVKSYGATHFLDRHLPGNELKAAISKVTDSSIGIVYDAISLPETQLMGWGLLAENGTLILTHDVLVKEDENKGRKAARAFGSPHAPQNQELSRSSWAMVEKWLSEGTIQPNKYEVLPNGLEGIIGGLERLKNGQVSGTKLVAHPQET
ncbi:GroES-like protein [Rhizopogon vinicolor AM-OR11-026]|uniref:GroES-like protein n=1 Tax=Rhizopogon vinicolor AM-OR11-026 TaxID=1314800 RepID=A0A1B7N476_9AGAM|nr:GroES-like protein [Rhizopogon vinicolor AM-OR11-026]